MPPSSPLPPTSAPRPPAVSLPAAATAPASAAASRPLLRRRKPVRASDWLLLALALLSVGLLSWQTFGTPTPQQTRWIIGTDLGICALFAVEFGLRWRLADWRWGFVARHWYEVLGMIPVAHPALRGFRLVRVVILFARLGRASDRAFGRGYFADLVERGKERLVAGISGAVTVAVIEEVSQVLRRGHYSRNIAAALAENRTDLKQMLLDKLGADPQLARLRRLPFYADVSGAVVEAGLRVVSEALADPRTDEFIADLLRENLAQIRAAVRENQRPEGSAASGLGTATPATPEALRPRG